MLKKVQDGGRDIDISTRELAAEAGTDIRSGCDECIAHVADPEGAVRSVVRVFAVANDEPARAVLVGAGINDDQLAEQLQQEGTAAFSKSWQRLLDEVDAKCRPTPAEAGAAVRS